MGLLPTRFSRIKALVLSMMIQDACLKALKATNVCVRCLPVIFSRRNYRRSRILPMVVVLIAFTLTLFLMRGSIFTLWAFLLRALRPNSRDVYVATFFGFDGAPQMLDELWFIGLAFPGTLVPLSPWLPRAVQLGAADLVICSVYGDKEELDTVAVMYPLASFLFISGENAGNRHDHLVGTTTLRVRGADVSFGQRLTEELSDVARAAGTRYQYLPWWLPYSLDRTTPRCTFYPTLLHSTDAIAWRERPGFATLIASHGGYPREELYAALSAYGSVDAPGRFIHNSEWPRDLPNNGHFVAGGKIEYMARYRANICTENGLSGGPGSYTTEKLPQAHLAGAVPIYYGDPLTPRVWNPSRILRFNGTNTAAIIDTLRTLEEDTSAAKLFFSAPPLLPTAIVWLEEWCVDFEDNMKWLATRIDERRFAHLRSNDEGIK